MLFSLVSELSKNKKYHVYFEDNFDDDDFDERWIQSKYKPVRGDSRVGSFRLTSGAYYGNQRAQRGIQTIDDAAWYEISSKFQEPFNTSGKDFVLQFTVRFEKGRETRGGYLKLLGPEMKPLRFNGETPYLLMFGPDIAASEPDRQSKPKPDQHKIVFIINRNGTNYDTHQYHDCFLDELTHSYTLIIYANRSYEIRLDGQREHFGDLDADFELGGTEYVADPTDSMPDDWDNREEIPDPTDKMPADWDDREFIPDPEAQKPPEWRDHVHGKWEPPLIQNPNYLGEWKPRMIKNPDFKGFWTPRLIPNPDYQRDEHFGVFENISYVGIEVFQVKAGTIFDNILICDSVEYAEEQLRKNFLQYRDDELESYRKYIQDKEAEKEMKRLQQLQNEEDTDAAFYSESESDSESDSTTEEEATSNFIFPSEEITDGPTANDFQFPFDFSHNRYFLMKEKEKLRKGSSKGRDEWNKHRHEKRQTMEWPEYIKLSEGDEDEL